MIGQARSQHRAGFAAFDIRLVVSFAASRDGRSLRGRQALSHRAGALAAMPDPRTLRDSDRPMMRRAGRGPGREVLLTCSPKVSVVTTIGSSTHQRHVAPFASLAHRARRTRVVVSRWKAGRRRPKPPCISLMPNPVRASSRDVLSCQLLSPSPREAAVRARQCLDDAGMGCSRGSGHQLARFRRKR